VTADELKTLAEHDLHIASRVVKFELWLRVPSVYLSWADEVFLAFFSFNRINNLRAFNVAFSPIPTAPPIYPTILRHSSFPSPGPEESHASSLRG
jgi:hypothetical protein